MVWCKPACILVTVDILMDHQLNSIQVNAFSIQEAPQDPCQQVTFENYIANDQA